MSSINTPSQITTTAGPGQPQPPTTSAAGQSFGGGAYANEVVSKVARPMIAYADPHANKEKILTRLRKMAWHLSGFFIHFVVLIKN